jgi:ABC-type lipoprotein export system ATPase subunit
MRPKGQGSVLLYGPSGGGKTTLLYALRDIHLPNGSVTSMQPNSASILVKVRHHHAAPC